MSLFRFHDEAQVEGREVIGDRNEELRQQRLRTAMRTWPEIPRSRLEFGRHFVVDTATNELYTRSLGEIDAEYSAVVSYYLDEQSSPHFLERVPGARTIDELEAQRGEREQARAERQRPRPR